MQVFHCAVPPAPTDEGGLTLFIDTRRIIETFAEAEVERLRNLNVGYYMPVSGTILYNYFILFTILIRIILNNILFRNIILGKIIFHKQEI